MSVAFSRPLRSRGPHGVILERKSAKRRDTATSQVTRAARVAARCGVRVFGRPAGCSGSATPRCGPGPCRTLRPHLTSAMLSLMRAPSLADPHGVAPASSGARAVNEITTQASALSCLARVIAADVCAGRACRRCLTLSRAVVLRLPMGTAGDAESADQPRALPFRRRPVAAVTLMGSGAADPAICSGTSEQRRSRTPGAFRPVPPAGRTAGQRVFR